MLDHDVFGLDVAVDDALVVHVLQGRSGLLAVVGGLLLRQSPLSDAMGTFVRKSLKRHWEQY